MKSSVKTQRKVKNLPKKPVIGTSSFKVTNSRLVDGKCRNTNEVILDSDDEDEVWNSFVQNNVEEVIDMAKKIGLLDSNEDISKTSSQRPKNNIRIDTELHNKIYEAIKSIPISTDIQNSIKKYLDTTQEKMKESDAVSTLYEEQSTIWITAPSPSLNNCMKNKVDAVNYFYPRICVWIPHHFVFKKKQECFMCPTLNCNGKLISEGFTENFTYRKVLEAADHFYIMTHTYKCSKNKVHVFDGCNEDIVNQLHELSQRGYDVYRMISDYGVSKTLEHIAGVYKRNGLSDLEIIHAIKNLHFQKIKRLQKQYMYTLDEDK